MKMNKMLTVLVVVLIISLISCVCVYAVLDTAGNDAEVKDKVLVNAINKDDSSDVKELMFCGEKEEISFDETITLTLSEVRDVYVDENDNEYGFDTNGNLLFYDLSGTKKMEIEDELNRSEPAIINTEEATEKAIEYANSILGAESNEFSVVKVYDKNREGKEYCITSHKKYGEGKFVLGEICTIMVMADGTMSCWSMPNRETLRDFDESLLDGITEEMMIEFAKENLYAIYGDMADEYNYISTNLVKRNGSYALAVRANVEISQASAWVQTFYYGLE